MEHFGNFSFSLKVLSPGLKCALHSEQNDEVGVLIRGSWCSHIKHHSLFIQ